MISVVQVAFRHDGSTDAESLAKALEALLETTLEGGFLSDVFVDHGDAVIDSVLPGEDHPEVDDDRPTTTE